MLRRIPAFLLTIFLVVVSTIPAARSEASPADAMKFISDLADKATRALTAGDVPRPERVKRFRELLHDHFDVDTIGAWVLGRHWRAATESERKEYLALFERLIIATYVDRFATYSGEKLDVVDAQPAGSDSDVLVKSRLNRPAGGAPVAVDWRVRGNSPQHLRIVDVIVEGISMGQTQRSEFGSVINKHGGQVAGLLEELRKIDLPE